LSLDGLECNDAPDVAYHSDDFDGMCICATHLCFALTSVYTRTRTHNSLR